MIVDEELKRALEIKSILTDPRFAAYTEKVTVMYEYAQSRVDKLTSTFLEPDKLQELNFAIAQRNALGSLLLAKEELADENSPVDDQGVN